ncbi:MULTISPECIES: acyl-CoA dehydrogenase family protein [Mycobacteriaceae]|jgi:acyl-CoA dehydrogenase|uniref:acyl-CoA dehydrogenase family protein n=1 Tax=Mycolicibacterium TaxID=1866885 RepID=UPI000F9CAB07|nr:MULTISPECIES: acyl-CoA dehydrogenase family protein [Mycolicibacterium]MCT7365052.1 acyl-CoA dehydrogenase [Mycolicibacterium llatzerense]MCT7373024.1 acyl-CoA dehydrogenase [Mycolicibacterium llatzerense]MCX8560434.1 acyl-CoA dehydrogenase family protein [Mycolicibacterium mucogenicum]RUP25990.1 MAG: acyl-CoA dehydrogenase [Mycolicibacterium sp.]
MTQLDEQSGTAVVSPWETPERRALTDLAQAFTHKEIAPYVTEWEEAGELPRELHRSAAKAGLLGIGFAEEVGGAGGDLRDLVLLTEGVMEAGGSSGVLASLLTHNIALPHMAAHRDPDQVRRFVAPTLAGEKIGSLGVTEPDTGSDVAGIRTTAVRDGDHYVVNGAKMFITSAVRADFVTTAVRTGGPGAGGISLLVVERDTPGFTVSTKLKKMGWWCSDTAELGYADVRVPAGNLVGPENSGFIQIMQQFQVERAFIAVQCYATAQRCLDLTLQWVKKRETFGRALSTRQVIRHKVVDMATAVDVARTYTRAAVDRIVAGDTDVRMVSMAKNAAVAACNLAVDTAVQLHGGMGYLRETEVERHYRDSRILGIGGGTTEIMKEIIAKQIGL